MHVELKKPELERFIDEQVKAGNFSSANAAIEAAVEQMMLELDTELDDVTIDAINEAEAEADRGEGMELDAFRAEMRKKFNIK